MSENNNFDTVIAEHKELKTLFADIQNEFDCLIVSTKKLHRMLTDAQTQIAIHFEHEENEGFFDQIVARAPWLKLQVEQLRLQHGEFRERLQQIVTDLASSSELTLYDLSRQFDHFLTDYFRHEGRENHLVQEALGHRVRAKQ